MIGTLEKDGNEDFAGAAWIEAQDEREEGTDSEQEVEEGNTSPADSSDEESDADNSDEGVSFNLEYAWRLLKDEPKWMRASTENSSKRTKNSTNSTYTASPNSKIPSSYEFNSSSPMERPMGQKAAKRKGKTKENANATEPPSCVISDTINKRMEVMENLARLKEEENKLVKEKIEFEAQLKEEKNKLVKEKMEFEAMQFIMSDTSKMNDSQREFHEKRCNNLKEKYGW
ncbi:uncharacterized protein LOC131645942 [Vicia villosa]|uniref:uncharacterized protein LOC131645942 n=1 Tax=Vicia villosa TaxID=3911 RepID=UPI00273C6BC6|nr:uncharacterized protein LOC131645942 [Vicia villosa]